MSDPIPDRQALEAQFTFQRMVELRINPVRGDFDAAHLREINRRLFQDLPEYFEDVTPGEYRKPTPPGNDWVKYRQLESQEVILAVAYSPMDRTALARLESVLNKIDIDQLRELKTAEFTEELGKLYAELDYIHPFPDGNSRTLRVFTQQLAERAGYNIDWERFNGGRFGRDLLYIARDKSVNELAVPQLRDRDVLRDVEASREALADSRDIADLLKDAVRPARAMAFEKLEKDVALAKFPELKEAYRALEAAQSVVARKFAGDAEKASALSAVMQQVQGKLNAGEVSNLIPGREKAVEPKERER